jgi:RHS repeat-associated protein
MDDTIEEYTSTGTKTTTYLHGIVVDELLGSKATAWYDYHADALGSVTRLTDSTGATVSTYRYDAFGTVRAETGSSNTYEFTSREIETSSGLYYNRARYYDPGARQFIQKDPAACAGDSTSRYAYAGDNPVNNKDPSGKFCFPCVKWCQQWWGGWLPCGWGCLGFDQWAFRTCMFGYTQSSGLIYTCLGGLLLCAGICIAAIIPPFVGFTVCIACIWDFCQWLAYGALACALLALRCD